MTAFLRTVRLLTLAAWAGSLFFFAFAVVRVAFGTLAPHDAGSIVRGTLSALHHLGLVAGAVYLLATLALIASSRDSHIVRAIEVLLVLFMLTATAYSQFSVMPRMEADRLALGGDVTPAMSAHPEYDHFDHLHKLSVKVEGSILIGAILLLCFAPVHQRDNRSID